MDPPLMMAGELDIYTWEMNVYWMPNYAMGRESLHIHM